MTEQKEEYKILSIVAIPEPSYRIEIPALGVDATVVQVVDGDGFEEMGWGCVVQAAHGNPYVSVFGAHPDGDVEELQLFKDLSALEYGNEIIVHTGQGRRIYQVGSMLLLKPETWLKIQMPYRPAIVLAACWPPGIDTARIVVFAHLRREMWANFIPTMESENSLPETRALVASGMINFKSAYGGIVGGHEWDKSVYTSQNYKRLNPDAKAALGMVRTNNPEAGGMTASQSSLIQAVTPLAFETQKVAGAQEMAAQKQMTSSQIQTNAAVHGNNEIVARLDSVILTLERQANNMEAAFRNAQQLVV